MSWLNFYHGLNLPKPKHFMLFFSVNVCDCGLRFAAAVQLQLKLAQTPVETNTPTQQKRSSRAVCSEGYNILQPADPDSAFSMSASIHPVGVFLGRTLNPHQLCPGCNWPRSLICRRPRKGEFPNGNQISHYYYSMLLTSHLQCFLQSHTRESHISVSLEQDVCVCVYV